MATKTLLILLVTLIVVSANPKTQDDFLEKFQNLFQAGNVQGKFSNIIQMLLKNSTALQQDGTEDKKGLIFSKYTRTLEDYSSDPASLQRSLLNIGTTTYLNELAKKVVDFFLVHFESGVGYFVLIPIRIVADYILNWLLPCGIECVNLH